MRMHRTSSRLNRLSEEIRRDDGMALATVVAFSAILFLLATTLLMLTTQQQISTSHIVARNKALQVADAGVTAYLYQLRYDSTYYISHPSMGPIGTTEGSWTVTASRATSSAPITLRSVGQIPALGAKRTIVSTVRFPTFADYSICVNHDYSLGAGATIVGKVFANGNISNSGTITGRAQAGGTVSGGGTFQSGYDQHVATIDFSGISADMSNLKATAQGTSTYVAAAGGTYLGYRVILNGNGGTYQPVVSVNSATGALTLAGSPTAFTYPSAPLEAVMYFDDRIWLSGTYSTPATIVSSSNQVDSSVGAIGSSPYANSAIFIVGNIMPTDTNSTAVLGIVAPGDISIPCWYATLQTAYKNSPAEMDIWAALLTQNGTFHVDVTGTTPQLNKLYTCGSRTAQVSGNFSDGFNTRTYDYDERLDQQAPPEFPVIRTGKMKVDSWLEN